jgi:hypothetical protein
MTVPCSTAQLREGRNKKEPRIAHFKNQEEARALTDMPRISTILDKFTREDVYCCMIASYERHVLLELWGIYFRFGATFKLSFEETINRSHQFWSCFWTRMSIRQSPLLQYSTLSSWEIQTRILSENRTTKVSQFFLFSFSPENFNLSIFQSGGRKFRPIFWQIQVMNKIAQAWLSF